jgi:hypothetical protein
MTDEQLLAIERFLDRASHSLRDSEERLTDIGITCSVVLYSVNRRPNK